MFFYVFYGSILQHNLDKPVAIKDILLNLSVHQSFSINDETSYKPVNNH